MKSKKRTYVFKVALTVLVVGLLAGSSIAMASDPLEDVKSFSDFPAADLRHMLDGNILGARGALMDFPNGLSAQTCFVTPEAAEETVRRLLVWDPLPHEALKVFAYQVMRAPGETADFHTLSLIVQPRRRPLAAGQDSRHHRRQIRSQPDARRVATARELC